MTARGGSKGLPGKNLRPLAGKPLIAYTIEAAQASGALDRLILSTDDAAIAEAGRALGCDVPFLRPAELARDDTPHLPVIQHAVRWMDEHAGYQPDAVMILQPTSPLRRPVDILASIELLERSGADSALSVSAVPSHLHPMRTLRVDETGAAVLFVTGEPVRRRINRRQDLPAAWVMNGAIYVSAAPACCSPPSRASYGNHVVVYRMPADRGREHRR